jgi:iron complex transport system substrate-binding protein
MPLPKRIVCLTEETTETLYEIGADELIVGITAYTVRPERAKTEKPVVSRYIDAKIDKILELKPDIVLLWSDMQANIAAELIKAGVEVYCFNHMDVEGILSMIIRLGAITGKSKEALQYSDKLRRKVDAARELSEKISPKPKIYFEEWYNPIITNGRWVSEIIEICGGIDIYAEQSKNYHAKNRIVENPGDIVEKNPDIILASWCGKPFKNEKLIRRSGWNEISAVQSGEVHEIDSAVILQPGPAALTDGIDIISAIIRNRQSKLSGL